MIPKQWLSDVGSHHDGARARWKGLALSWMPVNLWLWCDVGSATSVASESGAGWRRLMELGTDCSHGSSSEPESVRPWHSPHRDGPAAPAARVKHRWKHVYVPNIMIKSCRENGLLLPWLSALSAINNCDTYIISSRVTVSLSWLSSLSVNSSRLKCRLYFQHCGTT